MLYWWMNPLETVDCICGGLGGGGRLMYPPGLRCWWESIYAGQRRVRVLYLEFRTVAYGVSVHCGANFLIGCVCVAGSKNRRSSLDFFKNFFHYSL